MKDREYSPTVANAFLTGFIVDKPSSGEASIKFTLSLGEKLAFSSSFMILLIMGGLFILDILRKFKARKAKLKNKASVSAYGGKGGFKS